MLRNLAGAWPTEAVWNFLKNENLRLVVPLSGFYPHIKILNIYTDKNNLIVECARKELVKGDTKGCILEKQR